MHSICFFSLRFAGGFFYARPRSISIFDALLYNKVYLCGFSRPKRIFALCCDNDIQAEVPT